jgi:ParB-like chromosome segregation protein Spo0J
LAQAEIARLVGRDRSTIAILIRLLSLPDEFMKLIQEGELSEGIARAILAVC